MHTQQPHTAQPGVKIARWVVRISCGALLILSPLSSGCKGSKLTGKQPKDDLLEAELRTREREILEARSELYQLRQTMEIYQRQGMPPSCPPVYPTTLGTGQAIRNVLLGTGTGGYDVDGIPGDESLQVVIVPKDADNSPLKAPGHVTVSACEITPEGLKRPIGKWEVSNDQLRKTWKTGFITNGYHVPLQWDRPPTTDKIRVSIQFVSAEGKPFEADRDVTVVPLPGMKQGPGTTIIPPAIDQGLPLPPPNPVIDPATILPPPGATLIPAVPK